ncbi:MAG: HlyD family efflux transporter periplasmic adaptor subunit [Clostridia bacterium]|nr:HlyD family efflux transporter periplasmic adaptor subunit [Clostridia bacterium]MDD4798140.1 HlyD family efflux transporter periplasmic adaptor subunit [Clostridia bacterium]
MDKLSAKLRELVKNKKAMTIILAAVGLLLLIIAFKAVLGGKNQGPTYSTAEVVRGDVVVGLDVTGTLNPSWGGSIQVPGNRYSESGAVSYAIKEVYVKVGDEVNQGDPIALLAAPSITTQLETLRAQLSVEEKSLAEMLGVPVSEIAYADPSKGVTVTAPTDGRFAVQISNYRTGTRLDQGTLVGTVSNDNKVYLTAVLASSEIKQVKDGDKAVLTFPSDFSANVGIPATITDVNRNAVTVDASTVLSTGGVPVGQEGSYMYVYWISMEADNPGLIMPGMVANVGIYDPDVISAAKAVGSDKVMWLRYASPVEGFLGESDILSSVEGVITKIHAKNMATVKKGAPLFTMAGQDVKDAVADKLKSVNEKRTQIADLEMRVGNLLITAPSSGVVSDFSAKEGASVSAGDHLGSVFLANDIRMWVQLDDTDITQIALGDACLVSLDALAGQTFEGEVTYVSPGGYEVNGQMVFEAEIKVVGNSSIKPGMQAKAKVGSDVAKDVLMVPLEGIFSENGVNMAEVLRKDGSVEEVEVELGLMNNRYAEIISGLEEGDLVITGSSADLLSSESSGNGGGGLFGN